LRKTFCHKPVLGGGYLKSLWGHHPLNKHRKADSLERFVRGLAMLLALLYLALAGLLLALAAFKVLLLAILIIPLSGLVETLGNLAKALCPPSLCKKGSFLSRH
jgi:hypothetical protein